MEEGKPQPHRKPSSIIGAQGRAPNGPCFRKFKQGKTSAEVTIFPGFLNIVASDSPLRLVPNWDRHKHYFTLSRLS